MTYKNAANEVTQPSTPYHTLAVELVICAERWLFDRSVGEEALSPQLIEEEVSRDSRYSRKKNLCAVNCASFVSRPLAGDP